MVDDGFENLTLGSVLGVAEDLLVQRITNAVNIAVQWNAVDVLRIGSTCDLIGVFPLVTVVVVVSHQIRLDALGEVVGQAIAIGVNRCSSIVWEDVRTSRTDTSYSVWTVANTVAIGVGVGRIGSWAFSRCVIAGVVFSRVEQSIAVNVLIQRIAGGIAIKVLRCGVSRLRVGKTCGLISIGGSITVIVRIFNQIALVIRWQFVRLTVAVRVLKNTELDGETGAELRGVRVHRVVGQWEGFGWNAVDGTVGCTEHQSLGEIGMNLILSIADG